jgi:hypothetical protein
MDSLVHEGHSRRRIQISPHTSLDNALANNHVDLVSSIELLPIDLFSVALGHTEEEGAAEETYQMVLFGHDFP